MNCLNYKDCYLELKKAMHLLEKRHAFEEFNYMNLFFILDENSKGIVVFSNQQMGDSYGIQIYFGDAGINYLYDSYMSSTGLVLNTIFADMTNISFVERKDLLPSDIAFLKKHKIRINAKGNLIPCEFKEGFDFTYLSIKKMEKAISYIYYLLSLLDNEKEDIEECFRDEKIVLAAFDTKEMYYEVRYTADLSLGNMPSFKKVNQDFVSEYQNSTYVDDTCHICRYFSPTGTPTSGYESILFGYYEKKETYLFHQISCKPKQITEYSIGFLDELFKKEGLPTKVVFNNRSLTSQMLKTLRALHIEVDFQRENEDVDSFFFEMMAENLESEKKGEQKLNTVFVS